MGNGHMMLLKRKRVVTGLLLVAVIGVATFFLSQPGKGSLVWHQREYRAALDRWQGNKSFVKRVADAVREWRGPSQVITTE
jgi:hypothetical protein